MWRQVYCLSDSWSLSNLGRARADFCGTYVPNSIGRNAIPTRPTAFCVSRRAIHCRKMLKVSPRIPRAFSKSISHNILRKMLYPSAPLGASPSAFRLRSLRHRSLRHRSVQRSAAQYNAPLGTPPLDISTSLTSTPQCSARQRPARTSPIDISATLTSAPLGCGVSPVEVRSSSSR